jgi:hypothetical protein
MCSAKLTKAKQEDKGLRGSSFAFLGVVIAIFVIMIVTVVCHKIRQRRHNQTLAADNLQNNNNNITT